MSTTITVELAVVPGYDALVAAIALPELRCIDAAPGAGAPFPIGARRFYREGISTRLTTLSLEANTLEIEIFSLAAPEDIELALRCAEHAAALGGSNVVRTEGAGERSLAELRALYDAAWFSRFADSGARALRHMIEAGRGPMQVPGPRRSYYLGTRQLAELDAAGPAAAMPVRLLAAIRKIQWIDADAWPPAGTLVTEARGRKVTLAMWGGEPVLFPAADYALVSSDPRAAKPDVVCIPAERVPELAGLRWQSLDERQGLIERFGADWPVTFAAARRHEVKI